MSITRVAISRFLPSVLSCFPALRSASPKGLCGKSSRDSGSFTSLGKWHVVQVARFLGRNRSRWRSIAALLVGVAIAGSAQTADISNAANGRLRIQLIHAFHA